MKKYLIIILSLILSIISFCNEKIRILEENQIEVRELVVYEKGINSPFTGKVISRYENEKLKSENSYQNGEIKGPCKVYYENGQLAGEGYFENKQLSGLYKEYYRDGKLEREGNYKDGKLEKILKVYYENGEQVGK